MDRQDGELMISVDLQMANNLVTGAQKSFGKSFQRCGPYEANGL